MLTLFKKKETVDVKQTIEEIHHEFDTASDKLLAEAQGVLEGAKTREVEKGKRLAKLGFSNTRETKVAEVETSKAKVADEVLKTVMMYKEAYPDNKFITEELVEKICKKYNLVMGEISRYTGFVPEKNLSEIEAFKGLKSNEHADYYECHVSDIDFSWRATEHEKDAIKKYLARTNGILDKSCKLTGGSESIRKHLAEVIGQVHNSHYPIVDKVKFEGTTSGLLICAPKSDMNTEGMKVDGFKLSKMFGETKFTSQPVPDPIVLQPVRGGYLILTMWGDESHDPELND